MLNESTVLAAAASCSLPIDCDHPCTAINSVACSSPLPNWLHNI